MFKRALVWLAALAVIAALVAGALWYRKRTAVVRSPYTTVPVEKADLQAKVTATGTLSARVTVQVGSQVSGRITDLFADFNSQVKKGQIVAKLDQRPFEASVQLARGGLAQAAGQLAKAKASSVLARRQLDRTKTLVAQGLANQTDLDVAQSAADSADADVAAANGNLVQAQASVFQAEVNLSFATIVSPIDGVVISRNVDVGQTVAASLQAPVIFTIAQDLSLIQVDTYVAEADVGKLKAGMDASFTVDAYPQRKFVGTVREVRNAASTVQNVVTYDAVLDVKNPDLMLKPGMTANVTFVWAEAKQVVALPNAALRFKPPPEMVQASAKAAGSGRAAASASAVAQARGKRGDEAGNRRTIWVLRAGQPKPVRVETGVTDGTKTEILADALELDDEVITDYAPLDGASTAGTAIPGTAGGGRGMRL